MKKLIISLLFLSVNVSAALNTISVHGKCTSYIEPDISGLRVSIADLRLMPKQSLEKASEKYNLVLNFLKKEELTEVDFKTEAFRTSKFSEWENSKSVFKGYKTNISFSFQTKSKNRVASLIEKINKLAPTAKIEGPLLGVSLELRDKHYLNCLKLAGGDAYKKAKAIAEGMGLRIIKPINVSEIVGASTHHPRRIMQLESMAKSTSTPTIEHGRRELEVQIKADYLVALGGKKKN